MNTKNFGEIFKIIRTQRGFTQEELAKNICHRKHITRIENGTSIPTYYLIHKFSQKLGEDLYKYLSFCDHEKPFEAIRLKEKIYNLMLEKNFHTLYDEINLAKEKNILNTNQSKQFLLWNESLCMFFLKKDWDKGFKLCLSSLEQTKSNYNDIFINNNNFNLDELRVLSSIGYYFIQKNELQKAKKILVNIINNMKNFSYYHNDIFLYIICTCNLLIILLIEGKNIKSLKHVNECIELSKHWNVNFQLGHLYAIKSYLLYSINKSDKSYITYINKSIAFFDIFGQTKNKRLVEEYSELLRADYIDICKNKLCSLAKEFI